MDILFYKDIKTNKFIQQPYEGVYSNREYKEIDNHTFNATLQYIGFSRGRSALNIEWLDIERDHIYISGMQLLHESLLNNKVKGDKITGSFTWKKQGTAILLKKANK